MDPKKTMRTTRGEGLESFLKPSLGVAADILTRQGLEAAVKWLRTFMNSDRHVSISYAIDRAILPRLRGRERQKPEQDRLGENDLLFEARARVIRDFEELLIVALRRDCLDFFDAVLAVITEVGMLACADFRRRDQYFLPRNPIAYLRAISEAYRESKPVNEFLGWKDIPGAQRNAYHAGEAQRFLRALVVLTVPDDPGYAKIRALTMGAVSGTPESEVTAPPVQELKIQLTFRGAQEIRKLQVLLNAAQKHGGLEKFLLLLAVSLEKQKGTTKKPT